jgi:hypothetical protein
MAGWFYKNWSLIYSKIDKLLNIPAMNATEVLNENEARRVKRK